MRSSCTSLPRLLERGRPYSATTQRVCKVQTEGATSQASGRSICPNMEPFKETTRRKERSEREAETSYDCCVLRPLFVALFPKTYVEKKILGFSSHPCCVQPHSPYTLTLGSLCPVSGWHGSDSLGSENSPKLHEKTPLAL